MTGNDFVKFLLSHTVAYLPGQYHVDHDNRAAGRAKNIQHLWAFIVKMIAYGC